MTPPTGRPHGRPRTKAYVTLMARVPQDLADQAKRYAGQHRQTMSDVLRDGLQWLMDEDRYTPFVSDMNAVLTRVSDTNTASTRLAPISNDEMPSRTSDTQGTQPEIVSDVKEDIPSLPMLDSTATQHEIVSDTHGEESEGPVEAYIVSDTNRAEHHKNMSDSKSGTAGKASDRKGAAKETTVPQPAIPPFDTAKYALGELCQHAHAYHGTGQSLRQVGGKHECLECQAARARAYRERQRQAQPA